MNDGTEITLSHPEGMSEEELSVIALDEYNKSMGVVFNKNDTVIRDTENGLTLTSPNFATNDQEKIQNFLDRDDENKSAYDIAKSSMYQSVLDQRPISSRASQFLNIPFAGEFLDEAVGNIDGKRKSTPLDRTVKTSGTEDLRLMRNAMASEKPIETFGLNVAGGVTAAAPIISMLPKSVSSGLLETGPKVVPKMLKAGVIGTAGGGLEGLFSGYGRGTDPQSRTDKMLEGGFWGSALGALSGPFAGIMHGGKSAIDAVFKTSVKNISKQFNISEPAAKVISITLKDGGDINAAIANIKRAGDEGMIADASKATEALLDAASTYSPEGATIVSSSLQKRMANSRQSGGELLDDTLGTPPLGPKEAVGDIANRTKAVRQKAYADAYASPIPYVSEKGDAILGVLDRIPNRIKREAIEKANELMQMKGVKQQDHIKATILDNGDVVFSSDPNKMPNIMQLDYLKRGLSQLAYRSSNLDNFGRLTPDGQVYQSLSRDLKNAVSDAVPNYGNAVKLGGDKISEEQAFNIGSKLLNKKTPVEDVVLLSRNASDAEKEAAKQGLRYQIENILNDVKNIASNQFDDLDAREITQAVKELSSVNSRTKIRAILGSEADVFLPKIDEIAQSSKLLASQAVNSKTAVRQGIKNANEMIVEDSNFFRGTTIGDAVKSLISAPVDKPELFREMYADIAKVLTQSKSTEAIQALKFINVAIKDGNINEAKRQFVVRQLALAGYASIPVVNKEINDKPTAFKYQNIEKPEEAFR